MFPIATRFQQFGKAVSTYPSVIKCIRKCYETQQMCDKVVDTCLFAFDAVPDSYVTQEIYKKAVSKGPLLLKYCIDRYKTQRNVIKLLNLVC